MSSFIVLNPFVALVTTALVILAVRVVPIKAWLVLSVVVSIAYNFVK